MDSSMTWSSRPQLHFHYGEPQQQLSAQMPSPHVSAQQLQAMIIGQKNTAMRRDTSWNADTTPGGNAGQENWTKKRKADDEPAQRLPKLPRRTKKAPQTLEAAQSWSPDVTMQDAGMEGIQSREPMQPVSPATANALMQPFLTDLGWLLQF